MSIQLEGFDLETQGDLPLYALQPWRAASGNFRITSYATSSHVEKIPTRDELIEFLNRAAAAGVYLAGWNTPFDISCLLAYGLRDEVYRCKWLDAMLLLKRLDTQRKLTGLKQAVRMWAPEYAGYEANVTFNPETEEEWAALMEYNRIDAEATKKLAYLFLSHMSEAEIRAAFIEAEILPLVAEANLKGLPIDVKACLDLGQKLQAQQQEALAALQIDADQIASPAKLGQLMYAQWGLPAVKQTDKGADSTDKEALSLLALGDDPRPSQVLRARQAANRYSKYVRNVLDSVVYAGEPVSRPSARICGTYTGRFAYSSTMGKNKDQVQTGFALHQMKRDPEYRRIVVAPSGYLLVTWDWMGQEMRLMADYSRDPTMCRIFNEGLDAHQEMANEIGPGAKRGLGKLGNLSLQYRTSANRLRLVALTDWDIVLTQGESEQIWHAYRRKYPGVPQYWETAIQSAKETGYAYTRGGRKVRLTNLGQYAQQQTAINFPIQGTGGDMKTLGLATVKRMLLEMGGWFAFDLHDAMYVFLPDDHEVVTKAKTIQQVLSSLPYEQEWGWVPVVPLPVDCKLGRSWGELVDVEDWQ